MLKEYKEISEQELKRAYSSAWSMENMAAHGAADNKVEYIGSAKNAHNPNIITDYYKDNAGKYWFENRAIVDGQIVSIEVYIFGRDVTKERKQRRYK